MSHKLIGSVNKGKVSVRNPTAGEVMVMVPLPDGGERAVLIPAGATMELAPKFTTAKLMDRSRNLKTLIHTGTLRIVG